MTTSFIPPLRHAIKNLLTDPAKPLEQPKGCSRRAAVAVVIRVQPNSSSPPPVNYFTPSRTDSAQSPLRAVEQFFEQDWVKAGEPEVLFIKRAARKGDRWNGHVAFPGGRFDEGDEWSRGTAVRECVEEVGLDLEAGEAIWAGEIGDRLISTAWGKVPLMVLAAHVFIYTSPTPPALKLQATEVASAHWIPISELTDPINKDNLYCDVAERLHSRWGDAMRYLIRLVVGKMCFGAVRLHWNDRSIESPLESKLSEEEIDGEAGEGAVVTLGSDPRADMLLWGITLGILIDLFTGFPAGEVPYLASHAPEFIYPNFTPWDIKMAVSAITWDLRTRNRKKFFIEDKQAVSSKTSTGSSAVGIRRPEGGLMRGLLDGYFIRVKWGIWGAILARVGVFGVTTWWAFGRKVTNRIG
ncbi:hypothetical protein BJ508DRAFT_413962 [Ascobolus immersus RN42]|uniref:Nudix hydrolase domain-containing protein n=1 Tax=Ascobolus immersus RN42 TaxID=1160509 RepID=A0A3N4IF26_ASCIM|nr:hypothetical protein BJ508DRAFT_413962 [Ascobolus immersus RN42]